MAHIVEVKNAFEPFKWDRYQHPGGITIREWLDSSGHVWVDNVPTVCFLNGNPILRGEWKTYQIRSGDVVNFIAQPQAYLLAVVLIVVIIAISILIAVTMDVPKTPGELPASAPVFSTRGQANAIRLGEPIECCYGRNRIYPSFASRPYFQYDNNQQFQYSLFCLGQGQYQIEQILIGDTDIDDFSEVEYAVYEPGEQVVLFPTSVITSIEAGGQTLLASNEVGYPTDGWFGPFPTNPAGTQANKIQIDLVLPKGLYETTKKGNLVSRRIVVQWQVREIDDAGDPLGAWVDVFDPANLEIWGATTTPQRKTYSYDVTLGRYESRIRRTNLKDKSHKVGNDVVWEAMRAFLEEEQNFPDVTLLAVKIRATNNLNDRTQIRFNVIAVRKLPMYALEDTDANTDGWTDPVPTRSIVWAIVDVFRAEYGGRVFDEIYYDWDTLKALDEQLSERGDYFDWIFRDPITVWEAVQAIARCGRCTPLLAGSQLTLKREEAAELPVQLFNQENILKGSFTTEVKLFEVEENDSLRIEYTEPDTGYKQEQVTCVLPGGTSDNPKDVRFVGIQGRAQAYREGMFLAASSFYLRENIIFETGMEGLIATFGDLVAISHDATRWGEGGLIVQAVEETDGWWLLYLSMPVEFTESNEYQVILRDRDASVIGPFTAHEVEGEPKQIRIEWTETEEADFLTGGESEPMLFIFGVVGNITKYGKIVKMEPAGGENVRITCVNDAPEIHTFDDLEVPVLDQPSLPPEIPDLPVIDFLYVTEMVGTIRTVQIAWTAALGAQYYVIETSEDGEHWSENYTTTQTSLLVQVRPGNLYVRVAGVNNGQGPWIEDTISVSVVGGLDEEIPWEFLEWRVAWFDVLNAVSYTVRVYDNTDPLLPVLKRTVADVTDTSYDYHYDPEALADSNLVREMLVTVDAVFEDEGETGTPSEIELSNAIPTAPQNPMSSTATEDTDNYFIYQLTWEVPEEDDLIRIKVWTSEDSGFDPEVDVPVYDFTAGAPGFAGIPTEYLLYVPLDIDDEHPALYWRVAVFDVWGTEIETNITDVQTIPAYP